MSNIAIIPARQGSTRLKNKNRKKIKGIPLFEWSINFAKKLKFLNKIIITSDDENILNLTKKKNKSVFIIKRPKFLAKKNSHTIDVVLHAMKIYENNFGKINSILLLQPTSPIRSLKLVQYGFKRFNFFKKKKSIISVSKSNYSLKKNFIIKNKNLIIVKNTNLPKYQVNGNFYFAAPSFLKKYKSFLCKKKTYPVIIKSKKISIDIDSLEDFKRAKKYLTK